MLLGGRGKPSSINFSCFCYNKWQKLSHLQQLAFVTDLTSYTSVGQKWKDFTCLKSRLLAGTFSPWRLWRTIGQSMSIFWKLDSWLLQSQSQQAQPYLSDPPLASLPHSIAVALPLVRTLVITLSPCDNQRYNPPTFLTWTQIRSPLYFARHCRGDLNIGVLWMQDYHCSVI